MFLPVLQTSVVQGAGGCPFLFDIIIFEAGSKFWVGVDKNAWFLSSAKEFSVSSDRYNALLVCLLV